MNETTKQREIRDANERLDDDGAPARPRLKRRRWSLRARRSRLPVVEAGVSLDKVAKG